MNFFAEVTLKEPKKALCCGREFMVGEKVFFDRMTSKRIALIGVPWQGTYSLHKIKFNPRAYGIDIGNGEIVKKKMVFAGREIEVTEFRRKPGVMAEAVGE